MDGGDDWKDEEGDEESASPWMLVAIVLVAITSFYIALNVLAVGSAVKDTAEVLVDAKERKVEAEERRAEAKEKRTEAKEKRAAVAATRQQTKAEREKVDELKADLFVAAYGDFDTAKRDEIAKQMIELTPVNQRAHRLADPFYRVGAHELVLELGPDNRHRWHAAALIRGDWERIAALDVKKDDVFSNEAARSLCLAGAQGKSLGVFKWLLENRPTYDRYLVADAVACGATPEALEVDLYDRANREVIKVVAAREYDELESLYERFMNQKRFRSSRARAEAAAALFVAGKLQPDELVEAWDHERYYCWGRMTFDETTKPDVLEEAAERLQKAEVSDKSKRDHAVEVIRIGAIVGGVARMDDRRRKLKTSKPDHEACLAAADYVFEPPAAVKRLKKMIAGLDKPNWKAHQMLAMAHARTGDFDAAFEQSQQMLKLSRSNHGSRSDANVMVIAFGHLSGRLDEVELKPQPEYAQKRNTALIDALKGTEDDRRAIRTQVPTSTGYSGPPAVAFYNRAALAPGHAEAYLDGMVDPNSGLAAHLRARAEVARWLGDEEAEQKWLDRHAELFERVRDGENGGVRLLSLRL